MFSPTEPTVSLTTRRVMYGIVFICGVNYVMRLFSISFIGVFDGTLTVGGKWQSMKPSS